MSAPATVVHHSLRLSLLSDNAPDMTRSDLVARLAERFGQLNQRDAEFAVKTILDAMSEALAKGHRIEIRGFGSFSISRRPPRMGRNPRSGEQVLIPEKLVPHFKPGKALREGVDKVSDTGADVQDKAA
jgi:integration host factor subunit beta